VALRDRLFQSTFSKLFVYNILWEDSEVDERFLGIDERSSVLSITGAGCTVAGMLSRRPVCIDAVDINPHHLALTALKVNAAVRSPTYHEFYDLFGRGWSPDPEVMVPRLAEGLPDWMQRYWKRHWARFATTMLHKGLTARMLHMLRREIGVDGAWLREMIPLSTEDRSRAIEERIAPVLARPHFKAFLKSPIQLVSLGINFQQRDRLVEAEGMEMIDYFVAHIKRVASTDLATNWFGWYVVAGHYDHDNPDAVPPYLRRDRYERSHNAPTAVRYHKHNLFDVMAQAGAGTWSHYTLCDAPDWLPDEVQRRLLEEIRRTSRDGAIVLARSVEGACMVERTGMDKHLRRLDEISDAATAQDRSRQYRRVNFYRVEH
jgi:S-adenosylmethionine-diacylglycerol 3-amino-3-carboxypropyl transferase